MRLVGLVLGTVLGLTVIVQGTYLLRLRRQVEVLGGRLEALAASEYPEGRAPPKAGRRPARLAGELPVPDDGDLRPGGSPGRPRPPRLLAPATAARGTDDPLPLPPGLDGAEAREQLRQFVLAQLARERQESRLVQDDRRQQRAVERRDQLARQLGLSPPETERWNQIFADGRAAREKLRTQVEAGELPLERVRQTMLDLRRENDRQLRDLLGEARMKQYEDLGGAFPGPGGGGGRGFGPGGRRAGEENPATPP